MAVQVSYPGVYIDEFTPAAPIQGAGTSTAAFIGINAKVPPNQPTRLTSWDAFVDKFTDGNLPDDDDYLWYAVRGFFSNGGKVCFVTAVSNARSGRVMVTDEAAAAAAATFSLKARRSGVLSPPITVMAAAAQDVPPATQCQLIEPAATIQSTSADKKSVTLTDPAEAMKFLGGDKVKLGTGASSEEATVARVSGTIVFFAEPLQASYANKSLRLADLVPFATVFRAENADKLVVGSIVTLTQSGAAAPLVTVVKGIAVEQISAGVKTFRVTVKDGLTGLTLYKTGNKPIGLQSNEFSLAISGQAAPYDSLSMSPTHPRYYLNVINGDASGSVLATPAVPPNNSALPTNRPNGTFTLSGGANHDAAAIRAAPLSFYSAALKALEGIADVNIVAVPDTTDNSVQVAVKDHCALLIDRFAILDAVKASPLDRIEIQRNGLENDKGFAALYYPWIEVASQKTGRRITVPPSGHVAGIYARTDNNRGVHKAPAGIEAAIGGALGVEQILSDIDQGVINLKGINVIRVFQHGGTPVVWGARTTSQNTNWQYVNIRRLFIYLEGSIQQGIRGSVFEPNNTSLWQRLKRTIGAFLTQQWRDGALFGAKAEDAFYVRIDEVLNPDNERALGRLTIEIGVRPSYPAEFIIVRIGIWQGGSSVSEA